MNILYATLGFPPAAAWGGTASVTRQNAVELRRRGLRVTVCASNLLDKRRRISPRTSTTEMEGVRVVYLRTHVLARWPGTLGPSLLSPFALRRLWSEVRAADIVHVHGWRDAVTLAAAWFARMQGKPLVLQPHGCLPHIINSLWAKRLFDAVVTRPLVRTSERLLALQESEVDQIVAAGGDPEGIRVIPNGLDDSLYDPAPLRGGLRDALGIAPDRRIVLFLGRINRKKGADLLVQAFARLPDALRRQLHLVIAGPDDGQLAEVRRLVEGFGLADRVSYPGLLTGDAVASAYVDAEVFVLPCRTDTFPMALIEACQAGTPIVLTESCEISPLLGGVAAHVVPVDPSGIAAGLEAVLTNETLRARYRAGGRRLMRESFSIGAVGSQLEEMYREMLDRAAQERAA